MNIIKFNYQLWKKFWLERKRVRVSRHLTKSFYNSVDEAIEMCKQHPRKYYVIQKSAAEWEILGSQEVRKMRKFSVARKDDNFMKLHETAFVVQPENLTRLIHERVRRKNKWWFLYAENYYKPVTKTEIEMFRRIKSKGLNPGDEVLLGEFIKKHS